MNGHEDRTREPYAGVLARGDSLRRRAFPQPSQRPGRPPAAQGGDLDRANYREVNRSESKDDFIHKTGVAEKEASETVYWLQICGRAKIGPQADAESLLKEAGKLLATMTTINRKAKGR
ncbi:MAG: four helix bundle protein [Verrucomicrobiae bacterium]|nr:four helix bundle protein [Verrucomicrobiae bacterium]